MEPEQFNLETNNPQTGQTHPKPRKNRRAALAVLLIIAAFAGGYGLGRNGLQVSAGKLEINRGPERSFDFRRTAYIDILRFHPQRLGR